MTIHLLPLSPERFPSWLQRCRAEYEADLMATGITREEARRQASESLDSSFPESVPTPRNAVFDIIDDADEKVGYLWVGRDRSDDPTSWWVWDIVIDPSFRGRGFGRSSMQLAEDYARSQGAATLGLSVFGFNRAARSLYESLGYETTSVKMRKDLTGG